VQRGILCQARTHPAYADRLARTEAHETMITRAFSGRPGRSASTTYVRAAGAPEAPRPAPYPVQRGLTRGMRDASQKAGDPERMQIWAGQSRSWRRIGLQAFSLASCGRALRGCCRSPNFQFKKVISQPTIQPTILVVLYGLRAIWQPRVLISCKTTSLFHEALSQQQLEFSEVQNCVSGFSRELAAPASKLVLLFKAAFCRRDQSLSY